MRQTLWQVQQGRNQSVVALPGPAAAMAEGLWARAPRLWLPVPVRSRGGGGSGGCGSRVNIQDTTALQLQARLRPSSCPFTQQAIKLVCRALFWVPGT